VLALGIVAAVVGGAVLCLTGAAQLEADAQPTAGSPAADAPAPKAPATPGLVIYRDPTTGHLGVPPPDVAADLARSAAPRPTRMVERQGTTPGGGVLLDGIPPMAITTTVDAAGRVTTRCDSESAAGGGQP
jgi:hypothetical protein